MPDRIKLTEEDFDIPVPIPSHEDKDVILGIRLFNARLARRVMKQILDHQEKVPKVEAEIKSLVATIKENTENFVKVNEENKQLKEKLEFVRNLMASKECGNITSEKLFELLLKFWDEKS